MHVLVLFEETTSLEFDRERMYIELFLSYVHYVMHWCEHTAFCTVECPGPASSFST